MIIKKICVFFLIFSLTSVGMIAFYTPSSKITHQNSLIVILGAGYLKNGTPVLALKKRLEKGIEVWNKLVASGTSSLIMVSGREEETLIMKEYLINHNIPEHLIVQDILGIDTQSTIKNAYNYSDKQIKPVFISQAYHIPRIVLYAWFFGQRDINYVATDRVSIPIFNILFVASREYIAILLLLLLSIIGIFF